MAIRIECVQECRNHLGEGPVWDVDEGALYWVDGTGRRVGNPSIWRWNPRTGKVDTWSLGQDGGALDWVGGRGGRVGNPSIWGWNPRTGKVDTWSLEHDVGALALRQDGGAVLALDDGLYFFDFLRALVELIQG